MLSNIFSFHISPSYNGGINKQQNRRWTARDERGVDEEGGVIISS